MNDDIFHGKTGRKLRFCDLLWVQAAQQIFPTLEFCTQLVEDLRLVVSRGFRVRGFRVRGFRVCQTRSLPVLKLYL